MTIELTQEELGIEMARYREPLHHLREMVHEWGLGTWQLSKFSPTWRIGWAHQLSDKAKWSVFHFSWEGQSLIGLLFDSGGDHPAWYMAGWVKAYNAQLADYWVCFLNNEIADRRTGKASKYDGRIGLVNDAQDAMYEYEDEVEREKMDYWSHTSPYDPSKLNRENAAKAEVFARTAGPLSVGSYRMVVIKKGEQPTSDFSSLSDAARRSDDIAFAPGNVAGAFVFNSEFRLVHVAIHPYVLGPKEKPVRATPYPDNIGKLMLERK